MKAKIMEFILLADEPNAYKQVARWYFDQWLANIPDMAIDKIETKLSSYVNRDKAPLLVLAKSKGELIGAVELKIREMDIYPDYEHWIGGVYVKDQERGNGVATKLVQEVVMQARRLGVEKLYIQTEKLDGGIYSKEGFSLIEQVLYKGHYVSVMQAELV